MISPKQSSSYWRSVSETVNYDGYRDWYDANGFCRKTFWTITLIGTVVVMVYYAYTVSMLYLARPAATQLTEQRLSGIQFPNVTICHSARFNKTYVNEKIIILPEFQAYGFKKYDTMENMQSDFIQWLNFMAFQPTNLTDQGPSLEFLYQYYFNRSANPLAPYKLIPFLEDAALQCPLLLSKCSFGAKRFDCCKNVKPIWTDYGTCYQINTVGRDGSSYQSQPGSNGGLKVWVNVNRSETPRRSYDLSDGLRVYFTKDRLSIYDDPVSIPPNTHALIRLESTFYAFDPSIENCTNNPPPVFGLTYSLGTCANECMTNLSFQYCSCKRFGYGAPISDREVCTPRHMGQCVLPNMMGAVPGSPVVNVYMYCAYEKCPRPCQQLTYKAYASYQNVILPNNRGPFPYNDPPPPANETDVFVFTAYFGEIKYTQVQSAPLWDFNTFISNVGGLVGLWTGLSVVSAVQVLIYCYYVPCCYEGGKNSSFLVPREYWKMEEKKERQENEKEKKKTSK